MRINHAFYGSEIHAETKTKYNKRKSSRMKKITTTTKNSKAENSFKFNFFHVVWPTIVLSKHGLYVCKPVLHSCVPDGIVLSGDCRSVFHSCCYSDWNQSWYFDWAAGQPARYRWRWVIYAFVNRRTVYGRGGNTVALEERRSEISRSMAQINIHT